MAIVSTDDMGFQLVVLTMPGGLFLTFPKRRTKQLDGLSSILGGCRMDTI